MEQSRVCEPLVELPAPVDFAMHELAAEPVLLADRDAFQHRRVVVIGLAALRRGLT